METVRPIILFISPCTPDNTGVGWEQRAFSMLLAYSNYLDVNLWLVPTYDNPNIERIEKLGALCKSITIFSPALLISDSELKARFISAIRSAQCIHLFRDMGLMSIRHKCIFWDVDELPVELRDSSRNLKLEPISPELIHKVFTRYSRAWKYARRVFSCSRIEVNSNLGDSYYMPNVYSTEKICRAKIPSNNLIFVGNTNFSPNVDAIFHFSKNILPLLPVSTNFTVLGRSPIDSNTKEKFNDLMRNPQIKFIYDVESCTPYYQQSAVAVVPIQLGGGTKLKVLEAFSHYCPVVSTSKGCEGLDVEDGQEVLLRDNPVDFAQACQLVILNPIMGNTLAEKAHDVLVSKYSQNTLNNLLHSCLSEEGIL